MKITKDGTEAARLQGAQDLLRSRGMCGALVMTDGVEGLCILASGHAPTNQCGIAADQRAGLWLHDVAIDAIIEALADYECVPPADRSDERLTTDGVTSLCVLRPLLERYLVNRAHRTGILAEFVYEPTGEIWRLRRAAGGLHLESISKRSRERGLDWAYAGPVVDDRISADDISAAPAVLADALRSTLTRRRSFPSGFELTDEQIRESGASEDDIRDALDVPDPNLITARADVRRWKEAIRRVTDVINSKAATGGGGNVP
jgi:hypothetical protein